jgi:pimeloyl-ACP methyl ester carboxylesterase
VYGLLCSNFHYKYQIPFLEEMGFQILIHDYRFHYASSQDGDITTCSFENITKDLHELLAHLKISKGVFVGHSMGVNICLEHARRYPADVLGLILISGTVVPPQDIMFDSNVIDLVSPYLQNVAEKYPKIFKSIWTTAYMNPVAQYAIFDGGFNKKQVEMEFIQLYMKKISELPKELFFHLLKIMHDHDVIGYLEEIKCPTLIIGGDIVKDGSHVPQADFPELINHRIHRFLLKKMSV